jgi:hypothetical protein
MPPTGMLPPVPAFVQDFFECSSWFSFRIDVAQEIIERVSHDVGPTHKSHIAEFQKPEI